MARAGNPCYLYMKIGCRGVDAQWLCRAMVFLLYMTKPQKGGCTSQQEGRRLLSLVMDGEGRAVAMLIGSGLSFD